MTTTAPVPRLPAAPVLFGRETLLAELEELARGERLLTLTGAGGSGKTVLATALAHRLAPDYPDGAAFVDLAAVSRPDEVLPAVAAALGVSPRGGSLAELLAEVLAEQRRLVVLDNCEHLLDAVPDLAPLVQASVGLVIATSRSPLGLRAERVAPVPPLPLPAAAAADLVAEPAVALFVRAAANAGIALDPDQLPAVAALCRAVDGLPLAIELVAAQTRVESPTELAATLHARLPALAATAHDVPDRQRTMQAAIGWSLDRLTAEQRRAFARLAVFAGGFDARGAAAVLEADRPATLGLLGALLDASLLTRSPPAAGQARFRMLEPLRDVARSMAAPGELAAAAERHAAFMSAEIERLCPAEIGIRTPEDLAQLRLEHPNLMAALAYGATAEPDQVVGQLVQLQDYWIWTGGEIEVGRVAEGLLASGGLSDGARADALIIAARGADYGGMIAEAVRMAAAAKALARGVADEGLQARVRIEESKFARHAGNMVRAARAAGTGLAHAERAGNLLWQIWATQEGWDYCLPDPRAVLERRLAQARERSMAFPECLLLNSLQGAYFDLGLSLLAEQTVADGLAIARRFSSDSVASRYETTLAFSLVRRGAVEEARLLMISALTTCDRIGWRRSALMPMSGLGEVAVACRDWRRALVLFAAANGLATRHGYEDLANHVDPTQQTAERTAADHLGPRDSTQAREIGEHMSYRQAADYALERDGATSRHPP